MKSYGLAYRGSKNGIAPSIVRALPPAERLVDAFMGGGALLHCAALSGKWKTVVGVEVNEVAFLRIKTALEGSFAPIDWVSRERWHEVKNALSSPTDAQIKYDWSFCGSGGSYAFSEEKEVILEAVWEWALTGDLAKADLISPALSDRLRDAEALCAGLPPKSDFGRFYQRTLRWSLVCDRNKEKTAAAVADCLSRWIEKDSERRSFEALSSFLSLRGYKQDMAERLAKELTPVQVYMRFGIDGLTQLKTAGNMARTHQMFLDIEDARRRGVNVEIVNSSYADFGYKDGDIVICDPPYANTQVYKEAFGGTNQKFDYESFYKFCRGRRGVYVCEYSMPDDFARIWEARKVVGIGHSGQIAAYGSVQKAVEGLWIGRKFMPKPVGLFGVDYSTGEYVYAK